MPVWMAALRSVLNLCLLCRSSALRDDRLQREKTNVSQRKGTGLKEQAFLLLLLILLVCEKGIKGKATGKKNGNKAREWLFCYNFKLIKELVR